MNIEKSLDIIKGKLLMIDKMLKQDQEEGHGQDDLDVRNRWGLTLQELEKEKEKNKELEESNQEKAKMLTEQNRNLQISYDSLQELFELRKYKNSSIPVSLVEEKILNPMKEEHDKAIKGFIKRDIPQCIEDGGIAQELRYFIGKIEELLEKRK